MTTARAFGTRVRDDPQFPADQFTDKNLALAADIEWAFHNWSTGAEGGIRRASLVVDGFGLWERIPEGATITAVRTEVRKFNGGAIDAGTSQTLTVGTRIGNATTGQTAHEIRVDNGDDTYVDTRTADRAWTRADFRADIFSVWVESFAEAALADGDNVQVNYVAVEVDYTDPPAQTWPALPDTPTPEATGTFTSQAAGTFAIVDTPLPLQEFAAAAAAWPTEVFWTPGEMAFTGGGGGPPAITGTVTVTQSAASVAAQGVETFVAAATVTQAAGSISATAVLGFVGAAAATQAAASVSGSATLGFTGSAAATQAPATIAADGTLGFTGAATVTQAAAAVTAEGVVTFVAGADVTQPAASVAATGSVTNPPAVQARGSGRSRRLTWHAIPTVTLRQTISGAARITAPPSSISASGRVQQRVVGRAAVVAPSLSLAMRGAVVDVNELADEAWLLGLDEADAVDLSR